MMRPRLAILADYPEERWISMDLAAEMLERRLVEEHADRFDVTGVSPPFKRRASRLPIVGRGRHASMFDRLVNRLHDYPRFLRRVKDEFDLYHVADHSYAMLVHALPPQQTGVYCHDLDAFRAILDPAAHPRPRWYRAVARHILRGLQKAAVVFHSTLEIRRQILQLELIDPSKLVQAPLGPADEFVPDDDNAPVDLAVMQAASAPFVMHVGSCGQRKRIDVLLDVFAELRRTNPTHRDLRLVKVGGEWTSANRQQIDRHRLDDVIAHLPWVERRGLAWLYRRTRALLFPSDAEGFGLPVIEALACGAPVVASDIPVLREVGGDAATYAPVADISAWVGAVAPLLHDASVHSAARRAARLHRAAGFSWSTHARIIADAYLSLPVLQFRQLLPGETSRAAGKSQLGATRV